MRWLPLVLALSLSPLALAPAPALAADAVAPVDRPAPITVLEHRLDVRLDRAGQLETTQTWKVRVDRPDAVSAGVVGPPGLDGARDGGAMMLRNLLIVPADTAPGTVFTLTQTQSQRKGPFSGEFYTAPGFPAALVEVHLEAPTWVPLSFWSDEDGTSEFDTGKVRTITTRWTGRDANTPARFAWSTWTDWLEAGAALDKVVDARIALRTQLGPALAANVSGLRPAEAAERTYRSVQLDDGPSTFEDARHAVQVVQSGHGNAAERAIVLISLLRAVGIDARPALLRPGAAVAMATSVPAPSLLTIPGVAVSDGDRILWIDPANPNVSVPRAPASLAGGVAWRTGDLPVNVGRGQTTHGEVRVVTDVRLARDGSSTTVSYVSATGTGEEWLRTYLGTLSHAGREEIATRWVTAGRPGATRVGLTEAGLESPRKPLKLTLQAREELAATTFGPGLFLSMPPLLAPSLAEWLPPNILVHEELSVLMPGGLRALTLEQPATVWSARSVSGGRAWRDGDRVRTMYEVERANVWIPADADAIAAAAKRGAEVLFVPIPSPATAKAMHATTNAPAADIVAAEAAIWVALDSPPKVRKVLKKALSTLAFSDLLGALAARTEPGNATALETLAALATADTERLAALRALERAKAPGTSALADALMTSADPSVSVAATLVRARSANSYSDVNASLEQAATLATQASQGRSLLGEVRFEQAQRAINAKAWDVASERLAACEPLLPGDPRVLAASALVGVHHNMPHVDVIARVQAAITARPDDPQLLLIAAKAYQGIGATRLAASVASSRARILLLDPGAWSDIVPFALADGDLALALEAAQRASAIAPTGVAFAQALYDLANLADEAEARDVAVSRGAKGTPLASLDARIAAAPADAMLAVLQHHDADVVRSANWLRLRANFRLTAGDSEGAARDGTLLTTNFADADGVALAFAASAGRAWSTSSRAMLNQAARQSVRAQAIRMEYDLIAGTGDPAADAKALKEDDPRARIIAAMGARTPNVAEIDPAWPTDLVRPSFRPPTGFRANRTLSNASGVLAFSDADRGATILVVPSTTKGLPPPLSALFTPLDVPIEQSAERTVVQLTGSLLSLYAAEATRDGSRVIAVGFTEANARRTLEQALK